MKKSFLSQSLGLAEIDPLCTIYYPWIHQSVRRGYWKGAKMEAGALLEAEGVMSKELGLGKGKYFSLAVHCHYWV